MALDTAKHKNILIKILKDIYTDATVSTILGFKGGTAATLFYGLGRFSVDLDFDLLNSDKEDYVFDRIKEIVGNYGTLKEARKKKFNLLYVLSYDDKDINAQNVKVEINRREFGSKYRVESYLGISMQVIERADMVAHKLCAMYERIGKTNRDIFDVQFFLSHDWPVNKKIIEERMGISYLSFLEKCIGVIEKFDDNNILAGMGELLTEKQKVWAKTKLKSEVLFFLKLAKEREK
jgi:predicted nucleotidyltransferase component of viral defense system